MSIASKAKCVSGVNFVPQHLPDELFYSFISRLQLLNCLPDSKTTLKLLFGSQCVIPSIDLPSHLDVFQKSLNNLSPFTSVAALIKDATNYPYFRAFLSPDRNRQINSKLFNKQGSGLKTAIGIVANRFGASPELKFCSDCFKEDIFHYGAPYWHRAHHLPGVSFCVHHHCLLISTKIQSRLDNRHSLLTPSISDLVEHEGNCSQSPMAIWFAKLSNDLLNSGLENCDPEHRKSVYWRGLENKHLIKGCQQVKWDKLSSNIRDFYDNFSWSVHQKRLFATEKYPLRWLNDLIQRPQRAVHPICHLLLIGYLFESLDTFVEWLSNYKSKLSTKNIASYKPLEKVKRTVLLDATISCRQIANLHDVSTNYVVQLRRMSDIPIAERRKLLKQNVIELIKKDLFGELTIQEVANKNHISVSSVYRILQASIDIVKYRKDNCKRIERDLQRSKWKQLATCNNQATIKLLRSIAPDTYAWLYRNDCQWLKAQNKLLMSAREFVIPHKINWHQRDVDYTNLTLKLASELKQLETRNRVTHSRILRTLGIEATVRRNQHQFPLLIKTFSTVCETIEQFQMMRVRVAIEKLISLNKAPQLWKIKRLAGLKTWTPNLLAYAEKTILITHMELYSVTAIHSSAISR